MATAVKGSLDSNISYDSPFLDMTGSYLPKEIKELFQYIRVVIYSDPMVSQAILKQAEYPITPIHYTDISNSISKGDLEDKWKSILERQMDIVGAMKTCGIDYNSFGTSVASINFPFKRLLLCPECSKTQTVDSSKTIFKNKAFQSTCKKCGYTGKMAAKDIKTKEISKLSYIFWDLDNLEIKYNNISGDHFYYYKIPDNIVRAVEDGDWDIISTTRLEIIDAVIQNKRLVLNKSNLFHYKRPGPQYFAPDQRGWGIPLVMPILKDVFYKRMLRKANEAIAFEHIVPLRMLFPSQVGNVSIHQSANLGNWRKRVESEVLKWKKDPNSIAIMPVPVGQTSFSGDGKLLLLTNELKALDEDIITGLGMIPEILKGGASWSGSNVSLRVVENGYLSHRNSMHSFIDWSIDSISKYFGYSKVQARMEAFKMADDIQRKNLFIDLADRGAITWDTALKESGLDHDEEYEKLLSEIKKRAEVLTMKAEAQAEAQGAAHLISSQYSATAQYESTSKLESLQAEGAKKREDSLRQRDSERQEAVANELSYKQMSVENYINELTRRFISLHRNNPGEFKERMSAFRAHQPAAYESVYDRLVQANIMEAELNSSGVQHQTQQEAQQVAQAPVEDPVKNMFGGKVEGNNGNPLPEAAPPRSENSSI